MTGAPPHDERLATAAPMSRGRSERISATLLGNDEGAVRCPRVLHVGLDFGRRSPLAYVRGLLKACGFSDEQEARYGPGPASGAVRVPAESCAGPDAGGIAPGERRTLSGACARPLHRVVLRPAAPGALDPRQPHASTRALRRKRVLRMNARDFHNVYRELIDENPLAIRAVLKVLCVEFTDSVPTLAVTCEARPRLLVNLAFVRAHCRTEQDVKALICHEFLHVLLRHTERFTTLTQAEHIAVDAVINAIIHRSLGRDYSGMMSRYYADARGVARLLRPPTDEEQGRTSTMYWSGSRVRADEKRVLSAWAGLYAGRLVADDIRDLARDLIKPNARIRVSLLGDHESLAGEGSGPAASRTPESGTPTGPLVEALDTALKAMTGSDVFRSPKGRGVGAKAYHNEVRAADTALDRWRRETYAVLRRHLLPDPRSIAREPSPRSFLLPVLSPGDRRAALRSLWSPFLPDARWETEHTARAGSAHVYLDVSGSMNAEMPVVVALLGRLSTYIRRPFWAFSNVVAPARIEQGRLIAATTGGTSMACVLNHVARTKPRAAIVVTDGYIEALSSEQVAATSGTRLHVIVTRNGNAALLQRAGLPYTQLSRLPS